MFLFKIDFLKNIFNFSRAKYFLSFLLKDGHLFFYFEMIDRIDYFLYFIENEFLDCYTTIWHYFLHLFSTQIKIFV